jgi:hypothetical protein
LEGGPSGERCDFSKDLAERRSTGYQRLQTAFAKAIAR